ncbi:hypothetical protein F2P56_033496 [Juglans regia]|uniref:Uncharacterized protein LOC109001606 n=2 Tax=Juglans regia TaxID=51240 RepID=A0A2I4FS79_JUGRE|nr:uncharacterized protein LOC109001606 [Juglans regia]KAF5447987.1 hypothetical protein F2P56_033496 [Juglans regia]
MNEFKQANCRTETSLTNTNQAQSTWQAPPTNSHKINWDVEVDKVNCKAGFGAIVRDWEGSVIGTMRRNYDLYLDPMLVETIVAFYAIKFCEEQGFKNVILEGNSLLVVDKIQKQQVDDTSCGMFIAEILDILAGFENWSVNHVGRDCNKAFHVLSKYALGVLGIKIDLHEIPTCILPYC